jgi:DNA-binding protein HU-beta
MVQTVASALVCACVAGGTMAMAQQERAAGKPMSKSQIYATLAERTGLSKAQVQSVMDELAELSYEEARNGFVIPGLGKLLLVDRAARTARNPATGEEVQVPAKKVVKFRIAKACQDEILKRQ